MKNLFTFIAIMLALIVSANKVNAQALDGSYTVTQGSTVTVQIGAAYQTTLKRATNVTYTWTAANSSIAIQSKTSTTCTIKGVTPTRNVRLNYQCSYRYDGYARSMNFYYDINVKSNTISVTRVDMSPESATMEVGETLQLDATAYPTNATNRNLNWTTEDYSVASVSSNGLVTARGSGKVWIWARATDGSGAGNYCVVTVTEPAKVDVGSIELSETEHTMEIGEAFDLTATVLPADAYNKAVQWASDNNSVATVTDGHVTAIGAGECDIICTSTDGSNISTTCHIKVNEAPRYWLTVVVPNGSYAIDVTNLDEITVRISPDEGYKVHSVTLNGEEMTHETTSTLLTLMKLEEDATLNAVFEKDNGSVTGIDELPSDKKDIHITTCNQTVNISGLSDGTTVYAYNINGTLLKATTESSFDLPVNKVYILRVGSRSYKIAL